MASEEIKIGPLDKLEDFSESFSSFSRMTQQLQAAYRELEQRYETLNAKLQETNIELRQSLGEKDRISSYLNNILENLNSGVVVIDTEGRVRLFNRWAERILKYDGIDIQGRPWAEIIPEDDRARGCLRTLLDGGIFTEEEKVVSDAEGNLHNVGFSTSLLMAPGDEIIGAVEVFYDLSKLKKMEREMTRVSTLAALGRMAATIAHEVRNPLGAISGFTSLLDRDIEEKDPRKKLVGKISDGVRSLNRTVTGLLDYTRDQGIHKASVKLSELIDEVVDNISGEAKNRGVEIDEEFDEGICNYPLDKDHFRQILFNLLRNAIEASGNGGKIKIVMRRKDAEIRIEIIDEGSGIPADVIGQIFEPFFTTRQKGNGLGLAIVKKLVEAHGGTIFAESNGENRGSRFVIVLPLPDDKIEKEHRNRRL